MEKGTDRQERPSGGPRVGEDGLLLEWMIARKPGGSWDPRHRHTSHLFAVYPGSRINPEKTPEWAEAARKSLLARGTTGIPAVPGPGRGAPASGRVFWTGKRLMR